MEEKLEARSIYEVSVIHSLAATWERRVNIKKRTSDICWQASGWLKSTLVGSLQGSTTRSPLTLQKESFYIRKTSLLNCLWGCFWQIFVVVPVVFKKDIRKSVKAFTKGLHCCIVNLIFPKKNGIWSTIYIYIYMCKITCSVHFTHLLGWICNQAECAECQEEYMQIS